MNTSMVAADIFREATNLYSKVHHIKKDHIQIKFNSMLLH